MADYNAYTETTITRVIALDLPTNWVELGKAITAMRQDLVERDVPEFDDTVTLSPPPYSYPSAGHRDAADFQLEFSGQIGLSDAVQSLTPIKRQARHRPAFSR